MKNLGFIICILLLVWSCGQKSKSSKDTIVKQDSITSDSNVPAFYSESGSVKRPPVVQDPRYTFKTSDFKPELQTQLDKLVMEGQLPSKDTLARNYLRDKCTIDELMKMMECEDQLLRVIAFRTIINRNEPDFFPILLNHLSDTAKVLWWYYDDACGEFSVADMCLDKVRRDDKLTRQQKDVLVSLVLTKHDYLDEASFMIKDIKPTEKYYPAIRKKAMETTEKCGDQLGACYALSKFKKQSDVDFLYKIFSGADPACKELVFLSIEVFPDKKFFPILTDYFENQIKKKEQLSINDYQVFCRTVAKFKTNASLKILTAMTEESTYPKDDYYKSNKEDVLRAIHKNKSPIYDNLYQKLKSEVNSNALKHLDTPDYDGYSYGYW